MRRIASIVFGLLAGGSLYLAFGQLPPAPRVMDSRPCRLGPELPDVSKLPAWKESYLESAPTSDSVFLDRERRRIVILVPAGDPNEGYPDKPTAVDFNVWFRVCADINLKVSETTSAATGENLLVYSYGVHNFQDSWAAFATFELMTKLPGQSASKATGGWRAGPFARRTKDLCFGSAGENYSIHAMGREAEHIPPGGSMQNVLQLTSSYLPGPVCAAYADFVWKEPQGVGVPAGSKADADANAIIGGYSKNASLTFGPAIPPDTTLPIRAGMWLSKFEDAHTWVMDGFSQPFRLALLESLNAIARQDAASLASTPCSTLPFEQRLHEAASTALDQSGVAAFAATFGCNGR